MQQRINEFFQHIYEAFREDIPEFLVKAHEFRVRHALRNLDDSATQAVMAKESAYGQRIFMLEETYMKVSGIIGATPEPLQPAMLTIVSAQVPATLQALGLPAQAAASVMGELADILNDYPEATPEQQQQAMGILEQITSAQESES